MERWTDRDTQEFRRWAQESDDATGTPEFDEFEGEMMDGANVMMPGSNYRAIIQANHGLAGERDQLARENACLRAQLRKARRCRDTWMFNALFAGSLAVVLILAAMGVL